MNSTHTVVITRENRGIQFLVGCAALFLLAKWLWTGELFSAAQVMANGSSDGSVKSVSGTVIPIVFDLVIAAGGVIISIALGVWAFVWDIIQGVREMRQVSRGVGQAELVAAEAAINSASALAAQTAVKETAAPKAIDPAKLNAALTGLNKRLTTAESRLDKLDPPPPPPETLEEKLARLEAENEALKAAPQPKASSRSSKS